METLVSHGYRVDTGATAITARYPLFTELVLELGLKIVWTAPYLGVYHDGRIRLPHLERLLRSGWLISRRRSRTYRHRGGAFRYVTVRPMVER